MVTEKEITSVGSINLLFDEINNQSSRNVCEWILDLTFSANPPSILNLIINSPGGELPSAFAIIDVMASSKIPVRTIGLGEVQSAGLMVFLAGTKGERILTPNTSILSHGYSWGSEGKMHDLIAIQKEFTLTFDRMLSHYKKTTGLGEREIKKRLLSHEDVYLTANEALAFGICDRVALLPS